MDFVSTVKKFSYVLLLLFVLLQLCFSVFQKKLNASEYGNDLSAVEKEYDSHQREHKIIYQFSTNVDQCAAAEVSILFFISLLWNFIAIINLVFDNVLELFHLF